MMEVQADNIRNSPEAGEDDLSLLAGVLKHYYENLVEVQIESGEADHIENIIKAVDKEKNTWKAKAVEERTNGNIRKAEMYDAFSKVAELKADELRLRTNQKPKGDLATEMVKEEADENVLTRFEKFKKWARENITGISVVAISIAGVITTVVMGAKKALIRGARAVGKFGRAVANIAKKFGPVLSALGKLISKVLTLGAKGIMFLSRNLLLAVALAYFIYNEYKARRGQRTRIARKLNISYVV